MPLPEQPRSLLGFDYSRAGITAARHLNGELSLLRRYAVVESAESGNQETTEQRLDRIWEATKKQMAARDLGKIGLSANKGPLTETSDQATA